MQHFAPRLMKMASQEELMLFLQARAAAVAAALCVGGWRGVCV